MVPEEVLPNQTLTVPLQVVGTNNSAAHVTLVAVDEGIQLTDSTEQTRSFRFLFGKSALGVEIRDLYGKIIDPLEGKPAEWRSVVIWKPSSEACQP